MGRSETPTPIEVLNFMTGEWELDYRVTQRGQTTRAIRGTGSLRYLFGCCGLTSLESDVYFKAAFSPISFPVGALGR